MGAQYTTFMICGIDCACIWNDRRTSISTVDPARAAAADVRHAKVFSVPHMLNIAASLTQGVRLCALKLLARDADVGFAGADLLQTVRT